MRAAIQRAFLVTLVACFLSSLAARARAAEAPAPDFNRQIAPLLKRYCAGCHNAEDRDGRLVLESFQTLQQGGKHGPVVIPGDGNSSRMIRLLTGQAKPRMPPEDNPRPKDEEISLLRAWIDAGARGPSGAAPDDTTPLVPKLPPAVTGSRRPITALAWSPDGSRLAVARYGDVELLAADGRRLIRTFAGHPGKITSVHFTADGTKLLVASGVVGLYGEARLWKVADAALLTTFRGHHDLLFAAVATPDGKLIVTAGYDRNIIVWDAATARPLRTLAGHNDAVYDLAISPDGKVLASASGDTTVKLWNLATGERLDTLSQPLKEQYSVAFSPDGNSILSVGVDHRIRVWQVVSRQHPATDPLKVVRFAHDAPIVRLAISRDGRQLATASEDRTVKLWSTDGYRQTHVYPHQSDLVAAIAFAPDGRSLAVGRMDGSLEILAVPAESSAPQRTAASSVTSSAAGDKTPPEGAVADDVSTLPLDTTEKLAETAEAEPNDSPATATRMIVPGIARGTIHATRAGRRTDVDLYRFEAKKGETWIVEIRAARDKSPLDSKIEVLDAAGKPIVRVLLRAVRDSYFLFQSIDSSMINDLRLFSGEEMKLNDYIYADGEVLRLHTAPQGPDSGFRVYPDSGKRYTYFDTTATTHALGEPCYVVEPYPPGAALPPNGLPVFPIYYENDDEATRKLGRDSRLTFVAPADGSYLVRVSDSRGFQGPDYRYQLTVRHPRPDFRVTLAKTNLRVHPGSGQMLQFDVDRIDGFEGAVRVDISGLPPGFTATTRLVIEAGQLTAFGTITAAPDAPQPTKANSGKSRVTATATIGGRTVTRKVGTLGQIKLGDPPKLLVWLEAAQGSHAAGRSWDEAAHAEKGMQSEAKSAAGADVKQGRPGASSHTEVAGEHKPVELFIEPGQTIPVRLRVKRFDKQGFISFGRIDAGRNLPFGVYIANVGLSGVRVPEGTDEQTFFLTADPLVSPQTRVFFLEAEQGSKPTTPPVILHVRPRAAAGASERSAAQ